MGHLRGVPTGDASKEPICDLHFHHASNISRCISGCAYYWPLAAVLYLARGSSSSRDRGEFEDQGEELQGEGQGGQKGQEDQGDHLEGPLVVLRKCNVGVLGQLGLLTSLRGGRVRVSDLGRGRGDTRCSQTQLRWIVSSHSSQAERLRGVESLRIQSFKGFWKSRKILGLDF